MHIIAKDESGYSTTFIVSMSDREIGMLTGKDAREIKANFDIRILDRYNHLENIESAQPRLDRAAKDLHALADMLARVDIVVPKEEPKKEGA
jgi:hypothetical protein